MKIGKNISKLSAIGLTILSLLTNGGISSAKEFEKGTAEYNFCVAVSSFISQIKSHEIPETLPDTLTNKGFNWRNFNTFDMWQTLSGGLGVDSNLVVSFGELRKAVAVSFDSFSQRFDEERLARLIFELPDLHEIAFDRDYMIRVAELIRRIFDIA